MDTVGFTTFFTTRFRVPTLKSKTLFFLSFTFRYLVWQEVFDNGVDIAKDTVVHVWKNENVPAAWKNELHEVSGVFLFSTGI